MNADWLGSRRAGLGADTGRCAHAIWLVCMGLASVHRRGERAGWLARGLDNRGAA